MNTFGQTIKKLRLAKNLTQQDLADKLKISKSYIDKIEKDLVKHPLNEHLVKRFSKALKTNYESLLCKSGYIDKDKLQELAVENIKVAEFLMYLVDGDKDIMDKVMSYEKEMLVYVMTIKDDV